VREASTPRRELGHVGQKQRRDFNHRVFGRAERSHVERTHNRRIGRVGDRARDRLRGIGDHAVVDLAQQHAIPVDLPPDDAVGDGLTAEPYAGRRALELCDPEEVLSELRPRDLVENLLADAVHLEDAFISTRFIRDDLVVRAWLLIATTTASASRGRRLLAAASVGLIRCRLLRLRLRRILGGPDRVVRRDHRLRSPLREQPGTGARDQRKQRHESNSGRQQPVVRPHKKLLIRGSGNRNQRSGTGISRCDPDPRYPGYRSPRMRRL